MIRCRVCDTYFSLDLSEFFEITGTVYFGSNVVRISDIVVRLKKKVEDIKNIKCNTCGNDIVDVGFIHCFRCGNRVNYKDGFITENTEIVCKNCLDLESSYKKLVDIYEKLEVE